MKFDLKNLWIDTVTVINKWPERFNKDKKFDTYYKNVLTNCNWHAVSERKTNSFDAISSIRCIVQIPEQENYVPYSEWVYEPHGITFSVGDYIFLGKISENEINCSNITNIVLKYQPNVIKIKTFNNATFPSQNLKQIEHVCISHYYIQGA